MNNPINKRPKTISQPNNAASVNELSSEAMDDINSISAGEFSTIQPTMNKRGKTSSHLRDWDSLPPLEEPRRSSVRQGEYISDLANIDIDDNLSFNEDNFARSSAFDEDSQIVDIDLEMDNMLEIDPLSINTNSPNQKSAQSNYSDNEEFNGYINQVNPFSAIDSNEEPRNFASNQKFYYQNMQQDQEQAPANEMLQNPRSSMTNDNFNRADQPFVPQNTNNHMPFHGMTNPNLDQEAINNASSNFNIDPYTQNFVATQNVVEPINPSLLPPFVSQRPVANDNLATVNQGQAPGQNYINDHINNGPFSDPAFLAAQTAQPSFYQDKNNKRSYHNINEKNNHGYVSPGVHHKNIDQQNDALEESFVFDKEDVERRTKEIWGHESDNNTAPINQDIHTHLSYYDKNSALNSQNNVEHNQNHTLAMSAKKDNAFNGLDNNTNENEPKLRLLNPDAPSTLINGYVYDLQNKSQDEVRSGLDRIIQKTSQAMIANQEARAQAYDGSILASDMFKGSRYEHNISEFNRNNQVNTKISGLVAKYNAAKNKPSTNVTSNNATQSVVVHHSNKNGDVSTVISQGTASVTQDTNDHRVVSQSSYAGMGSKNYKTIMSDSHNRLVSTDNFGRTSLVSKNNDTKSSIDFSFSATNSKIREPSSVTSNNHTQITKFDDSNNLVKDLAQVQNNTKEQAKNINPTVNIDSMLMPANSSDNNSSSNKQQTTNVDLSSFNFDIDQKASSLVSSTVSQLATALDNNDSHKKNTQNLRDEIKRTALEIDSLLPSLDDGLDETAQMPRCKLFDAPDLFESSQDNVKDKEVPLKIKPDFYTTSNDKPAIVDINPLENPTEVSTKVDHKNLDMELPELKDDKSRNSFESLSGLKDLGQALRSLADSLQPHQSEDNIEFNPLSSPLPIDPKFKLDEGKEQTIDAFSNLMASADEHFGKKSSDNKEIASKDNLGTNQGESLPIENIVVDNQSSVDNQAPALAQASTNSLDKNDIPPMQQATDVNLIANNGMDMVTNTTLSPYLIRAKSQISQCQYIKHSGLNIETIQRYNLGFDGFYRVEEPNINPIYLSNNITWQALIVPLNEDSFVAYNSNTILQNPIGEPERRYVGQGQCFNLNLLNGNTINKPLFICTNELDALALESLGCNALALGMPYNVMMVLTCLQNLCTNQDIKQIINDQCYLCLPTNNQTWQGANDALLAAFQTLHIPVKNIDLTCSCPSINQALVFNRGQLIEKLAQLQKSSEINNTNPMISIAQNSLANTNGLVLSLESLAKLELSNTLYSLSSSSISLSRLVLASLIENKYRSLVYAGSAMQWQMLCSLLSSKQGLSPIEHTNLKQLLGYKAKFLEMPWEMSLTKIDETIRSGLQSQFMSKEGPCAFMVDTFGYDTSLCTSLAPRFAQLAMEFNTPFVVWCTQEQKNIFSGNAFQSIEMSQGSPNEIIFRTVDNACQTHMFSTGN